MNNDDRRKREAYLISLEQEINQVSIEIMKYINFFFYKWYKPKKKYKFHTNLSTKHNLFNCITIAETHMSRCVTILESEIYVKWGFVLYRLNHCVGLQCYNYILLSKRLRGITKIIQPDPFWLYVHMFLHPYGY